MFENPDEPANTPNNQVFHIPLAITNVSKSIHRAECVDSGKYVTPKAKLLFYQTNTYRCIYTHEHEFQ